VERRGLVELTSNEIGLFAYEFVYPVAGAVGSTAECPTPPGLFNKVGKTGHRIRLAVDPLAFGVFLPPRADNTRAPMARATG
jgi:hypothetical protein